MFPPLAILFRSPPEEGKRPPVDRPDAETIGRLIREAETQHRLATSSLAGLLNRMRGERGQVDRGLTLIAVATDRALAALDRSEDDQAASEAELIAELTTEVADRRDAIAAMEMRVDDLRQVTAALRHRLAELRLAARAVRAVGAQGTGRAPGPGRMSPDEAEATLARLVGAEDPVERREVRRRIEAALEGIDLTGRPAEAHRLTGPDILEGLKAGRRSPRGRRGRPRPGTD